MELVIASIAAFASTNIDDIFVLVLFFGNKAYKTKEIVIGQYLGIGALITISFAGSFLSLLIDKAYIGLLGLIPIFLGIKSLIGYLKKRRIARKESTQKINAVSNGSMFAVAAVTFANGGDNIGIYIPLFTTLTLTGKLVMISIFLFMVAAWCYVGRYLSRHPSVARIIDKYGHIATPLVLILLGLYILYESGSFALTR